MTEVYMTDRGLSLTEVYKIMHSIEKRIERSLNWAQTLIGGQCCFASSIVSTALPMQLQWHNHGATWGWVLHSGTATTRG